MKEICAENMVRIFRYYLCAGRRWDIWGHGRRRREYVSLPYALFHSKWPISVASARRRMTIPVLFCITSDIVIVYMHRCIMVLRLFDRCLGLLSANYSSQRNVKIIFPIEYIYNRMIVFRLFDGRISLVCSGQCEFGLLFYFAMKCELPLSKFSNCIF